MSSSHARESVIDAKAVSRRFGKREALANVNLSVRRGTVHGLVGANGAGKTTLIRHVLGLLRAQQGTVRVFGLDPVAEPAAVLSRIGYLSEENDLPGWMRIGELIRYTRAFYPGWNDAYAEELRRMFGLDLSAKVRHLSRGQKARAGLLVALAHRPELLVLDEPSSGLDPIVRRDIVGAVIRAVAEEGRTVLFSSHLLDEVEQVADDVTMISGGRIVLSASLRELKTSHQSIIVRFEQPQTVAPLIQGIVRWQRNGSEHEWSAMLSSGAGDVRARVESFGARIVEERASTLDEIFVAHAGSDA